MTSPSPSGNPVPGSSGGFPKWIIIVVVALVVLVVGCCGGFYACTHFIGRAARTAGERARQVVEEAQRRAEEEARRQREAGNVPANPGEEAPGAGGNPAVGGGGGELAGMPATRLPGNFPQDVPVYSGLKPVIASSDMTKGEGYVLFGGAGDPDKVVDYYKKELASKGWALKDDKSFNNMTSMEFSKEGRKLSIIVSPNDKEVGVQMSYSKE